MNEAYKMSKNNLLTFPKEFIIKENKEIPEEIKKEEFKEYYYENYMVKKFSEKSLKLVFTSDISIKKLSLPEIIKRKINHVKIHIPNEFLKETNYTIYWEIQFLKKGIIYLHNISKDRFFEIKKDIL